MKMQGIYKQKEIQFYLRNGMEERFIVEYEIK